jgi:dihydrofolate synthase/folylpolyglutamate synthase
MTYTEAIQFLYDLRLFGAKFGLENTLTLAALAGNPQQKLRFIHVAGTNGKGSTCAMLESIYRAAGMRVGLFTSPHLVSFAERIQVNRQFISDADVVRLVTGLRERSRAGFPPAVALGVSPGEKDARIPQAGGLPTPVPAGRMPPFTSGGTPDATERQDAGPTFFEFVTVMALLYFVEQNCDLVLWETGLGGRLDATNIVTPLASVITNIGIEHSEWLGDTFDKIAVEKAGIIKPGVPVITAARPREGLEVIACVAQKNHAPLTVVDESHVNRPPLGEIELPLHGPHQKMNAATTLAAVHALAEQIPVSDATLRGGLSSVYWPGRMQRVQTRSGQTIVLDGAHNPAGAEALRVAIEAEFPRAKPTLIFGVFRDKDSASMCHSLAARAGRLILTPVHSDRSEDPTKLLPACREVNPHAPIEICRSLGEALERAGDDPFVVIAGSLYLIGEAMELLHLAATTPNDEKRLNEWVGKK